MAVRFAVHKSWIYLDGLAFKMAQVPDKNVIAGFYSRFYLSFIRYFLSEMKIHTSNLMILYLSPLDVNKLLFERSLIKMIECFRLPILCDIYFHQSVFCVRKCHCHYNLSQRAHLLVAHVVVEGVPVLSWYCSAVTASRGNILPATW